ncbi:MAG TPA: ABC transporter substrate-binding protein, partial [bacterium]|nr:ABC transporter substrate-binding protein [bacterium]
LAPDGSPRPHAALDLERNTDSTQYRAHLHPGLRWSDGTAVTAQQVIAGWEWTIDHHPLGAPAFALVQGQRTYAGGTAQRVTGFVADDATTITITLTRAEPKFATFMADPSWALCRGTPRRLGSGAVGVESMLGTGPYKVAGFDGRTCTLQRNRWHFGGVALLEKWQWQLLGSAEAVTRSYLAGALDAAPLAATQQVALGTGQWKGHLVSIQTAATVGLVLNQASPAIGPRATRQAFAAIAQTAPLRAITWAGAADPAGGHFSDRLGTPDPPPVGRPGTRAAMVVTLAVPAGEPDLTAAAARIAAEAAATGGGWRVEVQTRDPRELLAVRRSWDAALWLLPGAVQPVLPQAAEFAAVWSRWGWSGTGRAEQTEAALAREALWRPLLHPRALWLRSPRLQEFLHPSRQGPDWAGAHW